jgi:hypothetical protein
MSTPKTIVLIRLGQARKLTLGFAEEGVLELDTTRIKPMG